MAGNVWGNIFSAVLGGIASSSERKDAQRADKESTREAGIQNRATAAFEGDQEYYYNQLLRDERRRSLDSGYNQFSTIRNFAPNYTGPAPLDVPEKPSPGAY